MRITSSILLGALTLSAVVSAQSTPRRPNFVLIVADDWGYSDIGAFGGEIRTPNLDALAKAGVRFTNFHAAGSCAPTRAMLQTGVSNHRNGLGNMPETIPPEHIGQPGYEQVLSKRTPTIAEILRGAGYRTYLTGKWHLGKAPGQLPHDRGYDRAFSMADAGADNFEQKPIQGMYAKADWTENGRPARLPTNYYSSTFIVDKIIEYLEHGRASGRPFLASVNFLANHTPVQAPDAYIARYAGRYDGGWTELRLARRARAEAMGLVPANVPMMHMGSTPDWATLDPGNRLTAARAMEAYAGMAEAMDAEVGRLVDYLKSTGDYENTVFIFLSDNGAEALDPMAAFLSRMNVRWYYDTGYAAIGRRGSFTAVGPGWASASSSPLRGYKFTAYEGGLRVPLILAWPGNKALGGGRIVNGFAYATDIAPTLLHMAGIAAPAASPEIEPITGRDLFALAAGGSAPRLPGETLGYELSGNAALFRGDFKLVKNLPPYGDGVWHLFDIVNDPGETKDLKVDNATLFREMRDAYRTFADADKVLSMPKGYSAASQINANAFQRNLRPRLIALAPWVFLLLVAAIGVFWWRRQPRQKSRISETSSSGLSS